MTKAVHSLLRYQVSNTYGELEPYVEDLPSQEYAKCVFLSDQVLSDEVCGIRFAQSSVALRCAKAIWASLSATPAVDSHSSPFGRHLTYRENMSAIAVVVHGSLLIYVLDRARGAIQQMVPVIRSKVHCVCCKPCGLGYVGVGTETGILLLLPQRESVEDEIQWTSESLDPHAQFAVDAIDFHPNGRQAVAAGPKIAGFYVYDIMTGASKQCRQACERVYDVQYSPCGGFIMTVSDYRWVHIWSTQTWNVIKFYGSREGYVCSVAWSCPEGDTTQMFMSFSDSSYLAHCCVDRKAQASYKILQSKTAHHLSTEHEQVFFLIVQGDGFLNRGEQVNCAKCLCWETTGQRLAVLLDHPHPKVGSVAVFRTEKHTIEFLKYMNLDLPFSLSDSWFHASMTHRHCKEENSVEFAVYIRGIVACFTVQLDKIFNKQG